MATGEFELIRHYFCRGPGAFGAPLGIGDDCALVAPPTSKHLAMSMDTLVADVHFPQHADPELIGERALRVNLSDLAAMGASPLWFTLGLTIPKAESRWLEGFSKGLFNVAHEYDCALIGGDTTRGPLNICIQVHGVVSGSNALLRGNAAVGDIVFVTGTLGDGAAAVAIIKQEFEVGKSAFDYFMSRFYRPEPKVREGKLLCGIARAAIDVSDGLLADLGHICEVSGVGAVVNVEQLPISEPLQKLAEPAQSRNWALSGGDDYQLCFTVPRAKLDRLELLLHQGKLQATAIGEIVRGKGVTCLRDGEAFPVVRPGYQHFGNDRA
ncbi:thiamine-phosphate kinase [Exilibacterium tricleocarpae]|uniref:Thiamine-monophosphate kinase n=1 Tax=Exilibacterium tricleocarpae TaxID=2591008 RepID=A0A545SPP4_9GAMM|nr:thiamine-phosphate kinase [Exilibacterium tricleocarpae]TQV66955.1 thiamine-phosphate kinase [Exilibacterium tricleocarpae]